MFHVKVSNIHGKEFAAKFETRTEAENWLNKHIKNGTFGKQERKVIESKAPKKLRVQRS